MRTVTIGVVCALGAIALGLSLAVQPAHACGGLFCNSAQPVNQAAERILFVENGDGTVTAIIEIQYEGPAESFSWVLPVPGVPEVAVSSTVAFDRLQAATNPQYTLNTTFEGDCRPRGGASAGTGGAQSPTDGSGSQDAGVSVLASGTVGPFDYQVITVDPAATDPADVAIEWLNENGYDVTALGPEVLGPYLAAELNLLAFRLNKSNDSGSIRPIVISYEAELPFIPIRPTAVAANDDMGVMVWVAGASRAVPDNYKALELNEALINWYNPMSTYNDVVSAAANESGGQGFVTEFAQDSNTLDAVVLQTWETQEFDRIVNQQYDAAADFVTDAMSYFGGWDGFDDALRGALTLPAEIEFDDVLNCPSCYLGDERVTFDESGFRIALYEDVYRPMLDTQEQLLSRPYVTRFYTTMSADEMTMDPAFNFNADLDDVSNIHTAEQIIDCEGGFRVLLPQGETVYGQEQGVWPNELADGDLPAARKIMQLATEGQGEVVQDNSDVIADFLERQRPGTVGIDPDGGDRDGGARDGGDGDSGGDSEGCDCAAAPGAARARTHATTAAPLLALLAFGWLARRRRR
jgi:MYXO-CTERM domain-containing protein